MNKTIESISTSEKVLRRVAAIVSWIFSPFWIPTFAFILLFTVSYLKNMPTQYKLLVTAIVACFTIIMPGLGIGIFRFINNLTKYTEKKHRHFPALLTLASYVFCMITMLKLNIPWYMTGVVLASLTILLSFYITNFFWKISEHTAGLGGVIGGVLSFSSLFGYNPIVWLSGGILIVGLLGSARIILNKHTLGEVFGGFFIGLACTMIVLNPMIMNFIYRFLLY